MGCWYCNRPVPTNEVVCPRCGALNNGIGELAESQEVINYNVNNKARGQVTSENTPEPSPSTCTDDPPNGNPGPVSKNGKVDRPKLSGGHDGNPEPAVETAPDFIVLPLPADPGEAALALEARFGVEWMWQMVDRWQLDLQRRPKARRRGRQEPVYRGGRS